MCVSTLCGKTFCEPCFDNYQYHSCNIQDIEIERERIKNIIKDSPIPKISPFFTMTRTSNSSLQQIKPRKSQRLTEEADDDDDSDYKHRERKDIDSNEEDDDDDDDDDSEFEGLEGA